MIMCLLHGEYHIPERDCAAALTDFWMNHLDMETPDARNLYQLLTEQRMLANEVGTQNLRKLERVMP